MAIKWIQFALLGKTQCYCLGPPTSCLCTKFGPFLMLRLGLVCRFIFQPTIGRMWAYLFLLFPPTLTYFLFARSLRSREIGSRVYSFVETKWWLLEKPVEDKMVWYCQQPEAERERRKTRVYGTMAVSFALSGLLLTPRPRSVSRNSSSVLVSVLSYVIDSVASLFAFA